MIFKRFGVDISNWTELDQFTADWLHALADFVCIGLQDRIKARDFKAMIYGDGFWPPEFHYYVEAKNLDNDLTLCAPNEWVWIAIEKGGFENAQDVRDEGTIQTQMGLRTAIYCNENSIKPVFGDSHELADFGCPLIYADYRPPLWNTFKPFNGWTHPEAWQCSNLGLRLPRGLSYTDINCDLLSMPTQRFP